MIRYTFVNNKILEIYRSLPELSFPINIIQVIDSLHNCKLMTYQKFAQINNCDVNDVIALCESKSGCTHYDVFKNRYLILYNQSDAENNKGRRLWTIAHELGHIFCEHMTYTIYSKLINDKITTVSNIRYETEADYFAATLLSPFPLYKTLSIDCPTDIQNIFGLSATASEYRFNQYLNWKCSKIKTAWENDMIKIYKTKIQI